MSTRVVNGFCGTKDFRTFFDDLLTSLYWWAVSMDGIDGRGGI